VTINSVIYRRHECTKCQSIFISMQQALSEEMVEVLAEAFETAKMPTLSFEEMQSD